MTPLGITRTIILWSYRSPNVRAKLMSCQRHRGGGTEPNEAQHTNKAAHTASVFVCLLRHFLLFLFDANFQPITKALSNNVLPHDIMYISEPHPAARLIIDITRVNAAIAQDALKSFFFFFRSKTIRGLSCCSSMPNWKLSRRAASFGFSLIQLASCLDNRPPNCLLDPAVTRKAGAGGGG